MFATRTDLTKWTGEFLNFGKIRKNRNFRIKKRRKAQFVKKKGGGAASASKTDCSAL